MTGIPDPSSLRILVIGDYSHIKSQYPERTTLLWTGARPPADSRAIDGMATPGRVMRALREAREGKYDVVVAYPHRYSAWHPRYWFRGLLSTPLHPWAGLTRAFGVNWLRWRDPKVPVVAVDMGDAFGIPRSAIFLLDRAAVFLKRELPVDNWQVFYGSAHPNLPTLRFRKKPRWQRRLHKLRPISLPLIDFDPAMRLADFPDKTHDIFFIGGVDGNSSVRAAGLPELERLKALGYKIDQPTQRLDRRAYLERMSHSWIAWSPEGLGWDCNRHYEAAIAQSVPLMNHPTIIRHAPMLEGVQGLYYDPEPGGLERRAVAALADKDHLRAMAIAARDHAFAHTTVAAHCDYILRCAFDPAA